MRRAFSRRHVIAGLARAGLGTLAMPSIVRAQPRGLRAFADDPELPVDRATQLRKRSQAVLRVQTGHRRLEPFI